MGCCASSDDGQVYPSQATQAMPAPPQYHVNGHQLIAAHLQSAVEQEAKLTKELQRAHQELERVRQQAAYLDAELRRTQHQLAQTRMAAQMSHPTAAHLAHLQAQLQAALQREDELVVQARQLHEQLQDTLSTEWRNNGGRPAPRPGGATQQGGAEHQQLYVQQRQLQVAQQRLQETQNQLQLAQQQLQVQQQQLQEQQRRTQSPLGSQSQAAQQQIAQLSAELRARMEQLQALEDELEQTRTQLRDLQQQEQVGPGPGPQAPSPTPQVVSLQAQLREAMAMQRRLEEELAAAQRQAGEQMRHRDALERQIQELQWAQQHGQRQPAQGSGIIAQHIETHERFELPLKVYRVPVIENGEDVQEVQCLMLEPQKADLVSEHVLLPVSKSAPRDSRCMALTKATRFFRRCKHPANYCVEIDGNPGRVFYLCGTTHRSIFEAAEIMHNRVAL